MRSLYRRPSSCHEIDYEDHAGDQQQHVNEAPGKLGNKPYQPENQQNQDYQP
jgi:hypothetical protein